MWEGMEGSLNQDTVSLDWYERVVKPLTSEIAMVSSGGARSLPGGRIAGGVGSLEPRIQELVLFSFSVRGNGLGFRVGREITSLLLSSFP